MASTSTPTNHTIFLSEYARAAAETDILGSQLSPILQGLFGEVGGVMSSAKKVIREGKAYKGFQRAAEEEFGDALWYLAALCRRVDVPLDVLFCEATKDGRFRTIGAASDIPNGALAHVVLPTFDSEIDTALLNLGTSAASLMSAPDERPKLVEFARSYLEALHSTALSFAEVAHSNLKKVRGAFLDPTIEELIDFDEGFGPEEQLPRNFEIRINQRTSGRSYLRWNGVFVGDPLTDNIGDPDGYRFHDIFHFAHAAILHWSPVMRALVRHKRKSSPKVDEAQDGGRAIVVEEGISAWVFARAKELDFFEGQDRVSLGILKTIGEFVSGYEVSQCPLKLWERAILDGFRVFRQIRQAEGGWVIGNRNARSICYRPLAWKE